MLSSPRRSTRRDARSSTRWRAWRRSRTRTNDSPAAGGRGRLVIPPRWSRPSNRQSRRRPPASKPTQPRALSVPLSTDRFLLRVTLTAEAHAKLKRAQDLMRHSIPNGDPAAIIDRALTLLVDDLEKRRMAQVQHPRAAKKGGCVVAPRARRGSPSGVGARCGRCAFVGRRGQVRGDRTVGVPSRSTVCARRRDDHGQPRVALSRAQPI